MSLGLGEKLGPYQILGQIGQGGMGVVYKARDIRLHRTVAIKVLPTCAAEDAEQCKRLLKEARAASALNHPNIVSLYDILSENGRDALVMEYVSGETLEKTIRPGGLELKEALHYAIQIAGALAAAHGLGIIHRDVKPGNIMITGAPQEPGTVKVLDFGLAKAPESLGPTNRPPP